MKFKAVIFDFDQVIVKSYADHVYGFIQAAKKIGIDVKREEIYARFGRSAKDIMRELHPEMSEREIAHFVKVKDKFYRGLISKKGVRLIPGAKKVLEFLYKNNVKMGIASSASKKNIMKCLRENGFGKYFKVIVAAEDVKHHKPNPEQLFKAAKALRVKPRDCIYIGDSENEVIAAKRAGMYGVGITTGIFSRSRLIAKGGRTVVKNHAEFLKFLKNSVI